MAQLKTSSRKARRPLAVARPSGYAAMLSHLKRRVQMAQLRAAVTVNRELIALYWDMGRMIVAAQKNKGYGKQVVERLAKDLQKSFPEMEGLSALNLWRMRSFYLVWSEGLLLPPAQKTLPAEILSQAVTELPATPAKKSALQKLSQPVTESPAAPPEPIASLPWGHNVVLLHKLDDVAARLWYARKAVEHGWSRAMLTHHIATRLHRREDKAITNFRSTLPPLFSDLAEQTLKDPYNFDFLTLRADAQERDLENGLLDHVWKFLLELGVGFAFVGRQVRLQVGGQDYYLDLLFYHLHLRCYVVIDLKMEAFAPEFAGKMNFYLSAVDAQMRRAGDQPSIGLLLCQERNRLTVEYALRDLKKPIGVAEWRTKLVESLPKNLKGSLPTIAEIEAELGKVARKKSK
jgi:predicted nuclease of restriction endonuclease-like (RecB) superfamily